MARRIIASSCSGEKVEIFAFAIELLNVLPRTFFVSRCSALPHSSLHSFNLPLSLTQPHPHTHTHLPMKFPIFSSLLSVIVVVLVLVVANTAQAAISFDLKAVAAGSTPKKGGKCFTLYFGKDVLVVGKFSVSDATNQHVDVTVRTAFIGSDTLSLIVSVE